MSSPDEAARETPPWIEELAKIRSDLGAIGHRVDQLELQLNALPLEKREAQQVEPTSKPIEPQPTVPKPAVSRPTQPSFQLPSRHVLRSTERATLPAQSHRTQADKEYVTPDVVPGLRKPAAAVKTPRKPKLPADIDWEEVIGGRWMTWVGAFTLLLAVGFGVHWAWSTLQTPPWVHVLSIHLLGAGFLVAAHFINRRGLPLAAQVRSWAWEFSRSTPRHLRHCIYISFGRSKPRSSNAPDSPPWPLRWHCARTVLQW